MGWMVDVVVLVLAMGVEECEASEMGDDVTTDAGFVIGFENEWVVRVADVTTESWTGAEVDVVCTGAFVDGADPSNIELMEWYVDWNAG